MTLSAHLPGQLLQRKCACEATPEADEEMNAPLQRSAINSKPIFATPPLVHEVLRSPGQPMEASMRAFMEPRFGHDFSQVRVHTDARSAESALGVNALAYTVGQDLVFGPGQYAPASPAGRRLLAHELTHVVQQAGRGRDGQGLSVGAPEDASEREADQASRTIFNEGFSPAKQSSAPPSIQRDMPGKGDDPIHAPIIADYRKEHDLPAGGKDIAGNPVGPSDAEIKYGGVSTEVEAKPAAPVPTLGDAGTATAARTLATYPVDAQGHIQGMNIDAISKLVYQALKSSDRAYIVVRGLFTPDKTNFDPSQPGETARNALVQWLGKGTFKDIEQRIQSDYGNSGSANANGGGSLEIEVRYKSSLVSHPELSGLPVTSPSTPPKTKAGSAGGPDPLATTYSKPYPVGPGKALSAFMKTPLGEKFKEMGKQQLKAVWDKTSVEDKIAILAGILSMLGAASYGLAKMPANEKKDILNLIISDSDTTLQQPLKEKGTSLFEMDFDPDFKPRKIRPPIGEVELK